MIAMPRAPTASTTVLIKSYSVGGDDRGLSLQEPATLDPPDPRGSVSNSENFNNYDLYSHPRRQIEGAAGGENRNAVNTKIHKQITKSSRSNSSRDDDTLQYGNYKDAAELNASVFLDNDGEQYPSTDSHVSFSSMGRLYVNTDQELFHKSVLPSSPVMYPKFVASHSHNELLNIKEESPSQLKRSIHSACSLPIHGSPHSSRVSDNYEKVYFSCNGSLSSGSLDANSMDRRSLFEGGSISTTPLSDCVKTKSSSASPSHSQHDHNGEEYHDDLSKDLDAVSTLALAADDLSSKLSEEDLNDFLEGKFRKNGVIQFHSSPPNIANRIQPEGPYFPQGNFFRRYSSPVGTGKSPDSGPLSFQEGRKISSDAGPLDSQDTENPKKKSSRRLSLLGVRRLSELTSNFFHGSLLSLAGTYDRTFKDKVMYWHPLVLFKFSFVEPQI